MSTSTVVEPLADSTTWGSLKQGLARLSRDRLGLAGLIIVLLVLLSAVFADWLAPYDPIALNVKDRLQAPSMTHLLGTDQLGRDLLSRVLVGGQVAMQVALISIALALGIGLVLGMLAGFGPRWLDSFLVLVFDTVRSFPTIMFALAVVALIGPSLKTVILVIVVTSIPVYGRVVRTQTLALRNPARIAESTRNLPTIPGDIPDLVTLPKGCIFANRCDQKLPKCEAEHPPPYRAGKGHYSACHLLQGEGRR